MKIILNLDKKLEAYEIKLSINKKKKKHILTILFSYQTTKLIFPN